ncbi:MAG: pseudouridine synthase [Pseudohongiellaceae bacterium]
MKLRLDKFISHAANLSREQARQAVRRRRVKINAAVARSVASTIIDDDIVTLDGITLSLPSARYLMLHKPAGYVCATTDAGRPTVLDLLVGMDSSVLAIGGRLDMDTTGLVLLSDDGQWLHRITSPNYHLPKTYIATLQLPVDAALIEQFASGIQLRNEDKITRPAQCRALPDNQAEVIISEGRYHQVKRMFAACNNKVLALHRQQIGNIVLDAQLQPGQYRDLTKLEVASVG